MGKNESRKTKTKEVQDNTSQEVVSPERRELIKKTAYVAPTIVVLGALSPLSSAMAQIGSPPPPPSPSDDEYIPVNI